MKSSLNPDKSSTFIPSRRPNLTRRGCKSQAGEINQRLIKLRHNPPRAAAAAGIIIPKKRLIQQLETVTELEKR